MKKFFQLQNNIKLGLLVSTFIVLAATTSSFAHKVNIFAYAEGDLVYTESYFPDGRKVEGGTIEVYDSQGNKLLTGTADEKGQFNFRPTKKDDLNIVLIASMGHKNSYLLSADELPDTIFAGESQNESISQKPAASKEGNRTTPKAEPVSKPIISVQQVDLQEIKKIIDQSLDQRLKPIIRELAKSQQKEKISPTEIFGGIGYIFGIIGIVLYFTKRNI